MELFISYLILKELNISAEGVPHDSPVKVPATAA